MELGGARGRDPKTLFRADSSRTLLDVIRDDPPSKDGHRSWRHFKEKLKRRDSGGRGSAWTSTVPVPTSDIPIRASSSGALGPSSARISPIHDQTDPPNISAVASGRFDQSGPAFPMRRLQREENNEDEEEEEESGELTPPVRMSLMSLLAETDEKIGMDGLAYMMEDEDEEEEEEEDGGGEYNSCCVCMVRHRGAAFMPCAHSFCRLCSREMWVEERGNKCPLCNNYILEILDVF
ncbi:RING/U-box superfamily protein [Striga hermonthica]|uniref:RING/U-box superfamily protein n=1 Tax=Striga hermonthica TaxID=68872 RepID=A0A9N7MT23_STRHE|nr:RING/U-box superfamily protein [Striga hermonthica]